jgi:uncharacterized protein YegP (UPF0339 family)
MYHLKQSQDGQHFFVLVASNHQTIMTSETYSSRKAAIDGIQAAIKIAMTAINTAWDYIDATSDNGNKVKKRFNDK